MSVLKPRSRLVYFRVSEDEFEQLNRVCRLGGARSLSDLLRSATQRAISGSNGDTEQPVAIRLQKLDDLISELALRVEQLAALVDKESGKETKVERKRYGSEMEKANAESA